MHALRSRREHARDSNYVCASEIFHHVYISATVPARYGRVRMPVSCLVRFCNVSKGRPIPLGADPGQPRGDPPQKIRPPLGAQNRYKTAQDDQELAYKVSKTVKDGSRGVQHCQRWLKKPPRRPERLPKRLHTSPGKPKSLEKPWFFYDFQDSSL